MIGSQNSTGLTRSPRCFATLTARIHPTRQALRQIRRRGLISDACSGQLTRCSRASSVFDCTFWTQTCTADQSGRDGCDDGDGQRLLLWPAHAYMPQAKGVLPGEGAIPGRKRSISPPSGQETRFAGFAVRTWQCGQAGRKPGQRGPVRDGGNAEGANLGAYPARRFAPRPNEKRPGTKTQCWRGFAADSLAVLQKSAHEPLRTV